jgi:acid phosphatase (class A)
MKIKMIFFLVVMIATTPAYAQRKVVYDLTPSRGHYRQIAQLNPKAKAKSQNGSWDTLKFPFDAAQAKRRLSLKPIYLRSQTIEDFKIPDPPDNSSEQTRAELNYLLTLQGHRTKLNVESGLYMADVYYNLRTISSDSNFAKYRSNLFFIGRSIGTWFNPENLPITAELIARVWQDASYFIWELKYKYARVRPYILEADIENLENTDWAAYPSGHAANSYINAYIYQELAPQFTDIFVKDAYDMAHSREILGVHYPSDSEASRIFARQFVNYLFENEQFKTDFENAKKEWAQKAKESFMPPDQPYSIGKKKTACSKTCD